MWRNLPRHTSVWLSAEIGRLGEHLRVDVHWQLLEQQVVQALFVDEALHKEHEYSIIMLAFYNSVMTFGHLDGDDVGFNALDKSKCRGSHSEAVFKLGGNLHIDMNELENARMPQRQVTNRWLLSIVRCHLHAGQVQVQRDTPLHGDLCNLV